MEVISSRYMKLLDLNSEYLGVPMLSLMENAGASVANVVRSRLSKGKVVVIAGTGNNGGDGMVAARHLASDYKVEVFLIGRATRIRSEETLRNWKVLEGMDSVSTYVIEDREGLETLREALNDADIIIDALLGTGVKGTLRGLYEEVVRLINSSRGLKIAVDVPSGLDPDSGEVKGVAVKADVTVTFHALKPGLTSAKEYAGEIIVKPIGIPPDASRICGPGDLYLVYKRREPWSKKGDFGRVLIIGGSAYYSGAPALSALASLRTGSDLAVVACPKAVVNVIRSFSPNLIVRPVGEEFLTENEVSALLELSDSFDSIVVGPGLGLKEDTLRAVREFLRGLRPDKPVVVDADALKALLKDLGVIKGKKAVLTPHAGEFKLLTGIKLTNDLREREEAVIKLARELNVTVLLKGHVDVISDGRVVKLNKTGNPGMTVGGTGDVLTGILATFLAWSGDPLESACAAAFVNGVAGDMSKERLGYHLTATDLIEGIPKAMDKFLRV
ncbi:MAG: bifunctional ADP-dependent NAD(P)H-hydrate dehydratase/NAD(P)H-hydrate epimerase [Thermofilum sp. ex4484_15]|nr:MAG: bifunctional ADP-dependent NAD(P)H-hydrate dehydratase/NAD(P)H-hydrate epimerase [Thermofilum sp. ex4484_15]